MAISNHEYTEGLHEVLWERGLNPVQEYLKGTFKLLDHGTNGGGLVLEVWDDVALGGPVPDEVTLIQKAADRAVRLQAAADETARMAQVATDAKVTVGGLPGWSGWTEADALAWLTANVDPEIKTLYPKTYQAMTALVRMVIALRNAIWSDLEGSQ